MVVCEIYYSKYAVWVNGDASCTGVVYCTRGVEECRDPWWWTELSAIGVVCAGQLRKDSNCVCGE